MKKTESVKVNKKNPTTNYPKDSHKEFCKRCLAFHGGRCPDTESGAISKVCNL